ncbi:HpcH/HpaI aldolase family protein [Aquirufa sp. ROCK2-A2]
MVGQDFRDSLRSGRTVFGTLITSTSPKMFDSVLSLGLDFVFFCSEHVSYNPETLSWMCRAFKAAGINPIIRILEPSPFLATQALDAGASAILVPYVEEVEDVLNLIGAVKFRPLKGKKLQKILHGEEKPSLELTAYLQHHNRNNTLLINIESPTGVQKMADFLAIPSLDGPGVDGIVLGPHDLSTSYEMPEQYSSKAFIELSTQIIQQARKLGVSAGGHTGYRGSLDLQKHWSQNGANIILHCSDMFLSADKLQEDFNQIKNTLGLASHKKAYSESI